MHRNTKILIALCALAVVAGLGFYGLVGSKTKSVLPPVFQIVENGIPDMPKEWRGKVDYARLDVQLMEISLRPEMAGLAVAVVEGGELRFVKTYGVTDRSTRNPVTPETVFRWASVSKTATGMLAATLANEGKLDLTRPISSWQTSLRLPTGAESRLSFAQLLSHQTGLTKNAYDGKLEAGETPEFLRSQLVLARLQCLPGTCHTYQNIPFDAATEIFRKVEQKPIEASVSDRFFRPLGMASASYDKAGLVEAKSWARPHNGLNVSPVKDAYWHVPAAAGIQSNIIDFAKWMQAMMGERPEVMSPSALALAQTPLIQTPRLYNGDLAKALSGASYGLGLRSFTYAGRRLVGHSGAIAGYRATMIFDPQTKVGVVAMWNNNWGFPFRIPFAVLDSYHQVPGSRWMDLTDIPLPEPVPQFPESPNENILTR